MRKPALEIKLEDRCVAYVEIQGGEALKLALRGTKGFPDRTVMFPRRPIWFAEFKREKLGALSAQQVKWVERLRRVGHGVYVIDTYEDFLLAVEQENKR